MTRKNKVKDERPFAEKHPKLNGLLGLLILLGLCYVGVWSIITIFEWLIDACESTVNFLSKMVNKLDAVVIVALITGAVSITGVIISSIVSKIIDYRKSRQVYLAQKREVPYGQFVDMVYKVQENSRKPGSYTNEQMTEDISKFSKELTLWGSARVAKRWVSFRMNGANPDAGMDNLFILEKIMNEMRKDMGLKKLPKGKLLAFFVNDIEAAMKSASKGKR